MSLILDVGCGHLASHVPRGNVNVDIQKPFHRPSNFVLSNANYLPFRNTLFDKVFFYDVIEHVENPSKCLREIHRVLKKKGVVEISTPNCLHWRKFFRASRGKQLELSGREHIATWTNIEMEILLENNAFENIHMEYRILKATEKYDSQKHILLDKLMQNFLHSAISGRNMIVTATK